MKIIRAVVFLSSAAIVITGIFYDWRICFPDGIGECPFDNLRFNVIYPLVMFSKALFPVSFVSYFVSDKTYRKWGAYAGVWFIFTWLLVLVTPAYRHSFFSMDPTKEQVSLWMSVAFVVISFGMFAWEAKPWKQLR
ncbi:MAG: hypothetical protein HGA38_01085 [Candidatus Moranbacteria bacterium]|nr:hypothetical protein [Candidatus Moranbacteria bacterium]